MSFADVPPWLYAALLLVLLVLAVLIAGLVGLRIVVRDTSEEATPANIRALAEFFETLLNSIFRRK